MKKQRDIMLIYIETRYRNNINPTDALIRLMEDNFYTVDEVLDTKND